MTDETIFCYTEYQTQPTEQFDPACRAAGRARNSGPGLARQVLIPSFQIWRLTGHVCQQQRGEQRLP